MSGFTGPVRSETADLANLHSGTARLIGAGVDIARVCAVTEGQDPDAALSELLSRTPGQLRQLAAVGITTVRDLDQLDPRTASYSDAHMTALAEQVDLARAALGSAPAYRRRGVDRVGVPRADVEVDIDMENVEQGAYLWGALVTERRHLNPSSTYEAFATWDELSTEVAALSFSRFWSWLTTVQHRAAASSLSFRAYCYNAAAENRELRALGEAAGVLSEVETWIASDDWVDMYRVVKSQLVTGTGMGLKTVAGSQDSAGRSTVPVAKSRWFYTTSQWKLDRRRRSTFSEWITTYNRNDVEATLAIRDWIDAGAGLAPPIESLEPRS